MAIFAALKKMRMFNFRSTLSIVLVLTLVSGRSLAQPVNGGTNNSLGQDVNDRINTITTAVPFLMIGPDSRAGGMGEVGVATPPDGSSLHWNAAKLAFIGDYKQNLIDKNRDSGSKMGFNISYSPWLKALVPDIHLAYLTGYGVIGKKGMQTVSGALRYFNLGNITFTDNNGDVIRDFNPNEFSLEVGYARKLSHEFSGALTLRYIYSNLTGGLNVQGNETRPGQAGAADLSFYYLTRKVEISDVKTEISAGINISNIGSKMSYTKTTEEDFIPINMRLGVGFKAHFDEHNSLGVYFDINKLLVPTQPIYAVDDSTGAVIYENGKPVIASGKDPNPSVPAGIFQSFADAPGGTTEELRELQLSIGLEYWYNNLFAIRAGYFYEHPYKGNRKFFEIGAGIRYNVFGLDFAYLIPTEQRHPLENTLRFTLSFDFDAFKKQNKEADNNQDQN